MAVSITPTAESERGAVYEIDLSESDDVAQAWLRSGDPKYPRSSGGLPWAEGRVGWHKTAGVTVTFTNAGGDALEIDGGNGVLAGWVAHPDDAETQAVETLPITGLRFTASADDQKVRLYTGRALETPPEDAGTPA